ncbi:MAG TPA: LacI family DNA-binding transcriptional regulator [Solirubrobacteraceae bacterium]|nr:LacI family DNA-binding transcriptional regulator [Solirubrobacteraceae bacterium]
MSRDPRSRDGRGQRPTIREIADYAGVSIATVSRVVNDSGYVSDSTRRAVETVVRAHGYTANRNARALGGGRTGLVGLTVPRIHPSYFSVIVAGVAEALYEHDMRIVVCPTQHEHDREVSLLERLMRGTTDGGLLVLPEESSGELGSLMDHGYQFVVVDPRMRIDGRVPTVSAAHSSGAGQAVRHLLALGHRRIAAITGPRGWMATEERKRGYVAALAATGVLPDPQLVIESNFAVDGGREAASALLELPEPPTAIFAFNDQLAIGAMHAALARGLSLPADLSIVGFDDTSEAELVTPALSTVRQPLAEMGRMAVSLLVRLLDDEPIEALHVELATQLVVRDSTAAPAGS